MRDHREASPYSLLIVALLECGGPMTLPEVAGRFARAGVAPANLALRSLRRCRPARAPLYRDGDLYALDPHDDGRWALEPGHRWVLSARKAVRQQLALVRRRAATHPDPAVIERTVRAHEERREKRGAELARLRCVVVHAFPHRDPEAVVREGQTAKLHRRLEADAKALAAFYQYGRLHGAARLRWGFLDEMIRAPWFHREETGLYGLKKKAHVLGVPLEIVARLEGPVGEGTPLLGRPRRPRLGHAPGRRERRAGPGS